MKLKSLTLIVLTCLVIGCGPKKEEWDAGMTPEQVSVSDFIGTISDISTRPSTFKEVFTGNVTSAEMKKYTKYYFEPETIDVAGNNATIKVNFYEYGGDENPIGTETWKLVKAGEGWKIESAPVP